MGKSFPIDGAAVRREILAWGHNDMERYTTFFTLLLARIWCLLLCFLIRRWLMVGILDGMIMHHWKKFLMIWFAVMWWEKCIIWWISLEAKALINIRAPSSILRLTNPLAGFLCVFVLLGREPAVLTTQFLSTFWISYCCCHVSWIVCAFEVVYTVCCVLPAATASA